MSTVRSYPPRTQPHRIMTSTGRAATEPAPSRFMQSILQHNYADDQDEGVTVVTQPEKKITQEEQDAEDKKARKRAMKNLVNSWQERLQLISVITTFFATTEAAMLVNTKPADGDMGSRAMQASNACLLGSLILHVYASVLSFLGAFLLIRYKLKEATRDELIAEGIRLVNSPTKRSVIKDVERDTIDVMVEEKRVMTSNGDIQSATSKFMKHETITQGPEKNKREASYSPEPPILSSNPHVEQVGLFMSNVSTHLLSRTHALCVTLAAVGFTLAIVGIMCYAWALESLAVKTFASACLGCAVLGMAVLWI